MGTGFTAEGELVYATPAHGLPLPPPVPGRIEPTFNGNGQYSLPDPLTGKVKGWTRASTVAGALEDTWMLDAWAKRMMLIGMYADGQVNDDLDRIVEDYLGRFTTLDGPSVAREKRTQLNALSERAQFAAGSQRAAEFGTATHAWCEYVDHGGSLWDVPQMFRAHVYSYLKTVATAGLRADRSWTERVVLNYRHGIAGTLDRLFWTAQGTLFLGDIKTSKGMDFSWLHFAIQLAVYHSADYVLSLDGTAWEPMPELDPDTALIALVPSDAAETARIVPMNMGFGRVALDTAVAVRSLRTQADKRAQSVFYPVASESTDHAGHRSIMARFYAQTTRTEADMAKVWAEYQDVWTDDLTLIGRNSLRSANTANA